MGGIFDEISGAAERVGEAIGDAVEGVGDAAASLFEGASQLVGIATAGAAIFVVGPGAMIPAFIAGAALGEALIRHRTMTAEERAFAESVFGQTLPPNDDIILTNLTGLEGRAFVCPNVSGQILVNIGDHYVDPMRHQDDHYPSPGKLLIHELTHAWQIGRASFVPGLVCEGIANQLAGAPYRPGEAGRSWNEFNLEQQATIVDEWFAPGFRGPQGFGPMRPEHPYFPYVQRDVRGRELPLRGAMTTSSWAVSRTVDHLDVFWAGPGGAVGSTWWDAAPGAGWGDHSSFTIVPDGGAVANGHVVAVARRADHLDVFWVRPDGAIGSAWWNMAEGQGWGDHGTFSITPPGAARLDSPVVAVARSTEHLDVFWIGPDGAIGSTWWDGAPGGGWGDHQPFPITPPGAAAAGSGLCAVGRRPDHLDLFWVGRDRAIGSTWWNAAAGLGWGDHQPFAVTPPGAARLDSPMVAVARSTEHLDVFWIGPDGAIGSTWWDGAPGNGWADHHPFPITPPGAASDRSGLAAVARRSDHLDVFWVGRDGAVGSTWWNAAPGNGWGDHAPFAITSPVAANLASPVASVSRQPDHLDVFWIGPTGAVASTWWHAGSGTGWADHGAFPITADGAARTPTGASAVLGQLVGDVQQATRTPGWNIPPDIFGR